MNYNTMRFNVIDNTNAKTVGLVRMFRSTRMKIGTIVLVSVKTLHGSGTIKRGEKYYGVVVKTVVNFRRDNHSYISFDKNCVVLLKSDRKTPLGSKIDASLVIELNKNFPNVVKISKRVL